MSVSAILHQVRETINNNYRVTNTITSSSGIQKEVFVKRISSWEFDRVATVDDMYNLGTDPDTNQGYYRDFEFYHDFTDVSEAIDFGLGIKERIDLLIKSYEETADNFIGSDDTTFPID